MGRLPIQCTSTFGSSDDPSIQPPARAKASQHSAKVPTVFSEFAKEIADEIVAEFDADTFPIEKKVLIPVDLRIGIRIEDTHVRCGGTCIQVEIRNEWAPKIICLVFLDSTDKQIREATKDALATFQTMEQLNYEPEQKEPWIESSMEFLAWHSIHKLRDSNEKWPTANLYCTVCDAYLKGSGSTASHIETKKHMNEWERLKEREALVRDLPDPTEAHLSALNALLKKEMKKYRGKTHPPSEFIKHLFEIIESAVQRTSSDVKVFVFGSVFKNNRKHSMALPDSDLNVGFLAKGGFKGARLFGCLEDVRDAIAVHIAPAHFVTAIGIPSTIEFTAMGVKVRVSYLEADQALESPHLGYNHMLMKFTWINNQLADFLFLIRLWAWKLSLDTKSVDKLGIPRYAFDLMAIHYLQQIEILPIIHKAVVSEQLAKNEEKAGKCPDAVMRVCRTSILADYLTKDELTKPQPQWNLGELFIGFFKFYVQKHRDAIVFVTHKRLTNEQKEKWGRRVFCIIDPFRTDNVIQIPKNSVWYTHFHNCLVSALLYFGIPRSLNGPLVPYEFFGNFDDLMQYRNTMKKGGPVKVVPNGLNLMELEEHELADYFDVLPLYSAITIRFDRFFEIYNLEKLSELANRLDPSDHHFDFDRQSLTDGYEPENICIYCDKWAHGQNGCPLLAPVPPMRSLEFTRPLLDRIDGAIGEHFETNKLDRDSVGIARKMVKVLEKYLRKFMGQKVQLTLFGSMTTGLGAVGSDADITLRFDDGNEPDEGISTENVLKQAFAHIKSWELTTEAKAVLTAKVPIVKFEFKYLEFTLNADLSFYNTLAHHNSELLRTYNMWSPDKRFAKLALYVKHLTKQCHIADASCGSLSSYGHVLMLISYLQQTSPPVLPRLQEDFRKENTKEIKVACWNVYFEKTFKEEWFKEKNTQSCAELLIGYFEWMCSFDFEHTVVQCRQKDIVTKAEKEWSRFMCVEDPFDLNHNLAAAITKQMLVHMQKTFAAARDVLFSSERYRRANGSLDMMAILDNIRIGKPPCSWRCTKFKRFGLVEC
ncbi:unnamed protein product [Caenorhabditis sp. 36 PRJEB53466]|nr:unnamed protein product [Caenorhabditis sp. 36 PRJEB53466]